MSAIICFDIRNFSTHFSYLSTINKTRIIINVIEDIFNSLDKAINRSRQDLSVQDKTFMNHTGDGFVAILYGKGRSLQSLLVASFIANKVKEILEDYSHNIRNIMKLKYISPLNYGIGIHIGRINRFNYQFEYPGSNFMTGFLGHGINLSSRVQESTKDHTFHIICTKDIYKEAISVIKDRYRESIEKYFKELGRHNLRGMKNPVKLYGVKINLANDIEPSMLNDFKKSKTKNRKTKTGF
jgi:class 3 adenylate cyclase